MIGAYPLRLSTRDAAGHDAGHIHAARISPLTGFTIAACGRPFGRYGTVDHPGMRPTCSRCRELAR